MVPASSFDTSIFALPPDDDSDEEPNEEADGTDDSVDRALASSGEEERLKKGSGLEWTMRTTGGGSRAGVADSIVQQGSLGTDDGSMLNRPACIAHSTPLRYFPSFTNCYTLFV
jgi:hypothetical protein